MNAHVPLQDWMWPGVRGRVFDGGVSKFKLSHVTVMCSVNQILLTRIPRNIRAKSTDVFPFRSGIEAYGMSTWLRGEMVTNQCHNVVRTNGMSSLGPFHSQTGI